MGAMWWQGSDQTCAHSAPRRRWRHTVPASFAAYPHAPVAEDKGSPLNEDLAGDVKKPLTLMLSAVGCMLLIGCLNVANLLRWRARHGRKRWRFAALGAQRATLIRGYDG